MKRIALHIASMTPLCQVQPQGKGCLDNMVWEGSRFFGLSKDVCLQKE